ncbi:mitogen-activated protein kinase 14-like [Symsagittifera roscoffensis]|uniref:mitogen-activated protein kinase 14-like n=1 Tax=Symsagittifera roscoffensis TaxID=84072 RepID=UPI00307C81D6
MASRDALSNQENLTSVEAENVAESKSNKRRKSSLESLFGFLTIRKSKWIRLSPFKRRNDRKCGTQDENAQPSSSRQHWQQDLRRTESDIQGRPIYPRNRPSFQSMQFDAKVNGHGDVGLIGTTAGGEWYYEQTFNRETWRVKQRFQSLKAVNGGAFGTVCSAIDTVTEKEVAIKRMNQPYKSEIHSKRALRELKLLRFVQHDNLISLVDAYTTATSSNMMIDLYLVMPLLDTDLHQLIQQFKVSSDQGILSQDYIHFFMYQILRGLKYLHSANIMHRDLKPSNIAIKTDCSLKIIDFGLCRKFNTEVTGYVQTRWYRAPEVMIDWKHYTAAVDMWSLGAILGEMLRGRPVFKEDDHVELLKKHIFICGTPDDATLQLYESEQAVTFIRERLNNQPRVDFRTYFNGTEPCTDLLERLLQMNPRDRLTAEQALSHPYFSQLHDPKDEKVALATLDDSSFEDISTTADLKVAIFEELQEIARFGPSKHMASPSTYTSPKDPNSISSSEEMQL